MRSQNNQINIYQFSAGFNQGDAISNEMISIQSYLFQNGFKGEIYSENIGNVSKKICKNYKNYQYNQNDIIIYHHSIHSSVLSFISSLPNKKILIYHNVTPHHYFENYDLKLTYLLEKGRDELKDIKDKFILNFADSNYNKAELIELGYQNVIELPIIMDFKKFGAKEISISKNRKKNIIFVGRIAPNKKQDDLIRFAKVFKEYYSKDFVLNIVGNCSKELELYKEELIKMIQYFHLEENVLFSQFIDDEKLYLYYQSADLFLSMSEHEGFCVPLIESMYYNIPIIAYSAGAVKNTLDGAGILFHKKEFNQLAEIVLKTLCDENFKLKIINTQKKRLQNFMNYKSEKLLLDELLKLIDE